MIIVLVIMSKPQVVINCYDHETESVFSLLFDILLKLLNKLSEKYYLFDKLLFSLNVNVEIQILNRFYPRRLILVPWESAFSAEITFIAVETTSKKSG